MTRRCFLGTTARAALAAPLIRLPRRLASPEFVTLWEAGTLGYDNFRIPGLLTTPQGSLLAWCEARRSHGDWAGIDVHLRRSTDGGSSWSEPDVLVDVERDHADVRPSAVSEGGANAAIHGDAGGLTANNPVLIADRERGAVHFVYCAEYARCFHRRSGDDGRTFSAPVEITGAFEGFRPAWDWRVIATGPGHGIQLRNGRLVVPVWLSTGEGGNGHRNSAASTVYSDDHGATWHAGELAAAHGQVYTYPDRAGAQHVANPSETVALQLADGRVLLNMRNESFERRRAISTSADGATGWTPPVYDEQLYDPTCHAALLRLTARPEHDRNRVLFSNPDSRSNVSRAYRDRFGIGGARENLTVKLSYDECATWPVEKALDAETAGYSDLAVGPDGAIYCLYEDGGVGGDAFRSGALALARFDLAWLTDGEDRLG